MALPARLQRIYDRYSEIDRNRGDYRYMKALQSLVQFYERLGDDPAMIDVVVDALIEDYENKQSEIVSLLQEKNFDRLCAVARELQSSIRHVVDEDIIEDAREVERASAEGNLLRAYCAWSSLYEKLFPVFVMLRQIRRADASQQHT